VKLCDCGPPSRPRRVNSLWVGSVHLRLTSCRLLQLSNAMRLVNHCCMYAQPVTDSLAWCDKEGCHYSDGPERLRSMTAMRRIFQFHAQDSWVPATSMEGVHGNQTLSNSRSLNDNSFDYKCMVWTCSVLVWHALLPGQSSFGHFRDQSRLQVVQAATTERVYARCDVWHGACLIHIGGAD
jgi:hypothetical protein